MEIKKNLFEELEVRYLADMNTQIPNQYLGHALKLFTLHINMYVAKILKLFVCDLVYSRFVGMYTNKFH